MDQWSQDGSKRTPRWPQDGHVGGHLSAILGHLGAIMGRLSVISGLLGTISGHRGAILAVSWRYLGPSWCYLGPFLHLLGERPETKTEKDPEAPPPKGHHFGILSLLIFRTISISIFGLAFRLVFCKFEKRYWGQNSGKTSVDNPITFDTFIRTLRGFLGSRLGSLGSLLGSLVVQIYCKTHTKCYV